MARKPSVVAAKTTGSGSASSRNAGTLGAPAAGPEALQPPAGGAERGGLADRRKCSPSAVQRARYVPPTRGPRSRGRSWLRGRGVRRLLHTGVRRGGEPLDGRRRVAVESAHASSSPSRARRDPRRPVGGDRVGGGGDR